MKILLTAILLTSVLSSFGQTGKRNCVCAESQITSKTEPDTIFYLQNGTPISLCGYKINGSNPIAYTKFILAFCLPDTLLGIDIWTSSQTCSIRILGDTLLVDEFESKSTEKIYLKGLEVIRTKFKTPSILNDVTKVKSAYENLSADKNSKKLQQDYISAFPSDTKTFLAVFQSDKFDQLYSDSHKYIEALENCATNSPTEVISKCVDIGKNLVWDADAVGLLQHISVDIAIQHPPTFVSKYKTLNDKEQDKLINFYADVENHSAYPEYQDLIDKLNSIGEKDIAKKLETARTFRKAKHGH